MTKKPSKKSAPTITPLMLSAGDSAATCGVSLSTWHRLNSAGKIPAALRLNGRHLWRARELDAWTQAGMPPREEWQWPPEDSV